MSARVVTGPLAGLRLAPVRHHSPRSAMTVRAALDADPPAVVAIEAPADAEGLIDVLTDPGTRPPVCLLAFRTDGAEGAAMWPYAAYSPEFVAMAWARERGVPVRFVDWTSGEAIASEGDDEGGVDVSAGLAAGLGARSFEEAWEAAFEAPAHDPVAFARVILGWADVWRGEGGHARSRARDARMRRHLIGLAGEFGAPNVVFVAGAFHVANLAVDDVDPALEAMIAAGVPTALTVTPFSFPRLGEQSGYGAGNRAPRWHQLAWDAGADYAHAGLVALGEVARQLRAEGFGVSLADTLEAWRLAIALAELRGKVAPGVDEVGEAAAAAMTRGQRDVVAKAVAAATIGAAVGQVTAKVGRNTLQEEFWREVRARRLPARDELETFSLRLEEPVQIGSSVFLHRLRVADVPYASYQGSRLGTRGPDEDTGGVDALARPREAWAAQWTPSTEHALAERIIEGETLAGVASRRLAARLDAAAHAGEAAAALVEAVVCDLPSLVPIGLAVCDARASDDDDVRSLAEAARSLARLAKYGTSRAAASGADQVIVPLAARIFARARLRLAGACVGDDEAVTDGNLALRALHDVAMAGTVDADAWRGSLLALADDPGVNPLCAGVAAGLGWLCGALDEAAVADRVALRLSNPVDPTDGSRFLAGFLDVDALVLVRNRAVVRALDAFLVGIPDDALVDALPPLRRALATLGPTERRYLVENVLALRGGAADAKAILDAPDRARLAEAAGLADDVLDDLDDLL